MGSLSVIEALDASLRFRWADLSFDHKKADRDSNFAHREHSSFATCPAVPVRVVINEAVNLARTFGAELSRA